MICSSDRSVSGGPRRVRVQVVHLLNQMIIIIVLTPRAHCGIAYINLLYFVRKLYFVCLETQLQNIEKELCGFAGNRNHVTLLVLMTMWYANHMSFTSGYTYSIPADAPVNPVIHSCIYMIPWDNLGWSLVSSVATPRVVISPGPTPRCFCLPWCQNVDQCLLTRGVSMTT